MKKPGRVIPWFTSLGALAILGALAGCGQADYGDIGRVSGKVTLDGKPYANAQVMFVPVNGRPSLGMTDPAGQYELTYIRDVKGALPGQHKVQITTHYQSTSDTDGGKAPPERIPPKYNRHSELIKRVDPGKNVIDFDLVSR